MDYYILRDKDKPVIEKDIRVWFDWYCHAAEDWKVVARKRIDKDTEIVTIFTGKDKQMHEPGSPPLLWQTEIHEGDTCEYLWGYATRAAAEAGHPSAVANVGYWKTGKTTVQTIHDRRNKSLLGRIRRTLTSITKQRSWQ